MIEKQELEWKLESLKKYLSKTRLLTESTIDYYSTIAEKINTFLIKHKSDPDKCNLKLLQHHLFKTKNLSKSNKVRFNTAKFILEYYRTGKINYSQKKVKVLNTPLGKTIHEFLNYRENEELVGVSVITNQRYVLEKFHVFIQGSGIQNIHSLNKENIKAFFNSVQNTKRTTKILITRTIKQFLKYANEKHLTKGDLIDNIPDAPLYKQEKLLSFYTKEELKLLLKSVGRHTNKGKRDYAVLLLLITYGIRSKEVSDLTFSNIDWHNSQIHFSISKNFTSNSFPLISNVGNAILDYIKNGRPHTHSTNVFVTCRPPFSYLNSREVSEIVKRQFDLAKIDVKGRKRGSHSLRHSLAQRMLKNSEDYKVISETLAHKSLQSAMSYLSIDTDIKKKCIIEVPQVAKSFYINNLT